MYDIAQTRTPASVSFVKSYDALDFKVMGFVPTEALRLEVLNL
jgi:hypothetical protein